MGGGGIEGIEGSSDPTDSVVLCNAPLRWEAVCAGGTFVGNCAAVVRSLQLRAPRPPRDAGRIPVRRKFLVRKCQPRETRSAGQLLVARPAFPRAAREPLRFSGRVELQGLPLASGCGRTGLSGLPCRLVVFVGPALFNGGCGQILPHHVLGSLQELRMEASARGNAQVGHKSAFVEVNVTWGAVFISAPTTTRSGFRCGSIPHRAPWGRFASRETAPAGCEVLCAGQAVGGRPTEAASSICADGIGLPRGGAGAAVTSLIEFGYLAESIVFECICSASSLYLSGRSDEGSLMPSEGFSSPISHFLLCLQCVHCEVGFIVSFLFR